MVRLAFFFLASLAAIALLILNERGINLEKISFGWNGGNLALYGVKYSSGKLTVDVFTLTINPSPSPVYGEPKVEGEAIKKGLTFFGKILSRIPLKVEIKDAFLKFGNTTVNVYSFFFERNNLSADFIEIFPGRKGWFTVENGKIYGNYHTYWGNAEFHSPFSEGFLLLSVRPTEGRVDLKVPLRVNGEKFSLKGRLHFQKEVFGTVDFVGNGISISSGFLLNGTELRSEGKIIYRNFSGAFSAEGPLLNPEYNLKGRWNFCGQTALITLRGNVRKVFLALSEGNIYGSGYLDFENLRGLFIATSGEEGKVELSLKSGNISLLAEDLRIRNLCGLEVSDLSLKGKLSGKLLSLKGNFSRLAFGPLKVENENFLISRKGGSALLSLSGDVGGLLLLKDGRLWGYLFGKLLISERPLSFSLPQVEGLLEQNQQRVHIFVKNISYDHFSAEDFSLKALRKKRFLTLNFSGNLEGYLKLSLRGNYPYRTELKGNLYGKDKLYPIFFKASGNLSEGSGSAGFENLVADFKYKSKLNGYGTKLKLTYDGFQLNLSSDWQRDKVSLKGALSFLLSDWGIYGTVPLKGFYSKEVWNLEGLPFCVYQMDRTIVCVKTFSAKGDRENIFFSVRSVKGLPIELFSEAKLRKGRLNFGAKMKVSTEFINSFLIDYSTIIRKPENLKMELSYEGKIAEIADELNWTFNQKLTLYSAYFYKPVDLYVSLFYKNREFSGFIGLADAVGGETFGSLSFAYPFGGTLKASFDMENLPFRLSVEKFVDSYLKLGIKGKFLSGAKPSLNATVSVGGYLNLLSYKFPSGGGDSTGKKTAKVNTDIRFLSSEPLYVKTPDGDFILTFNGRIRGKVKNINLSVNYGSLKLFDREYYVSGAKIKVENDKTYLYLPLTYYAPDRTIYLKIYGYLPWQNLKLDIRSTPPAPKEELLIYLVSGGQSGKGGLLGQGLSQLPLADLLLRTASVGMVGLLNKLSSAFVSGVKVSFVPTFDPTEGMVVGVDIEKFFGDFARLGYRWMPSKDPKATYLWGSMRFLFNSFLRFVRYSDGSTAATLRFSKELGLPF